ncbi:hypothetical protein CFNIH1_19835 [Citrobacter freundii CFNIH1]|nr:hypothetical protein CFNIH1_19835 [Citrobacter freundii CFNIH1]
MEAGSTPTRQADGIRRMTKLPGAILNSACAGPEGVSPRDGANNRTATIFPPGAWVAREETVNLPCPFTGNCVSRNDSAEVNGILSKNHIFSIHA